uniref:Ig-like domain-containing protein n=1 Tax=Cyprinus carpio carpio TaxID=630221 RepID=A0A8C1B7J9_CYPCA
MGSSVLFLVLLLMPLFTPYGGSQVEANPVVKVAPDQHVFRGETVTLTCDIQGGGNDTRWTYSWYKDGSVIPNSAERVYNITFNVSDRAEYSCEAKRSDFSAAVTLTVSDLPRSTLTVTPDRPVFTGETVTLKCVIETYSDWRYEWYKGRYSVMLQSSDRYAVNRDTLTIRRVITSDQDQYWCRGQRDERPNSSQSSSAVYLTVKDLPRSSLTVTPDSPVFTGETVTLKCVTETHSNWTRRNDQTYGRRYDWTYYQTPEWTYYQTPEWRYDWTYYQTYEWRYEWYKDSVMLQSSDRYTVNRDTLTIRGVITSDQGQYWCRGRRDKRPNSSHSSSAVYLTVIDSPTCTLNVTPDSPVFTEETLNLTCVIESYNDWKWRNYKTYDWRYDWRNGWTYEWRYEWYKGSKYSVMLNTSDRYTVNRDTLSIRGANESDQDQYWCRGRRDERPQSSHLSSAVNLTVIDLHRTVLTMMPDSPVFTGETVSLTCGIKSNHSNWTEWKNNLRYEWNKGTYSVKLNTSEHYTVNRDTLTIRGVNESDQDLYWCRGQRDGEPSRSPNTSVYLYVMERPKAVVKVSPDERVFRGERVTLTCDIPGAGHIQWTYSWFKDGSVIRDVTERLYSITSVSDRAEYSCRGERSDSQRSDTSAAVTLTVSDLPRSSLTVTPDSPVFTGETVTLKCVIETYSNWRYEWYKDSVMLQTSDRYTVNGDTLTIRRVITSDQGQYWCRGQRDGRPKSSHLSSTVSFTVMERPKAVVKVSPDERVFRGETVTLTCDIQRAGDIQWTYSWFKDGSVIRDVTERLYSITSVSDRAEYSCRGERSDSQRSDTSAAVTLTVSDLKPKPELTSDSAGAALTGNTVTLICRMNPATGWDFYWYKHTLNSETKTQTNSYRVKIDSVSDGGQYWCRAGRGKPVYYTQYSDALWVNVTVSPKAVVTVRPDERVFRGETVALRCDIKWGGDTEWTYRWEREGTNYQHNSISTQEWTISSVKDFHSGKYSCRGQMGTQHSQRSDAVTLTVSAEAQAAVRVSPQPWLTEGDSVTLICEVTGSSTGWTFSWFRDDDRLSDSSRGAGGSYTLSPAALQHTGVYTCRAERGRPAYYTKNSSTQTLWITGVSPSVSLVVTPNRSQHFSSDSLSLSCEDQRNSAGWTVRRYTDRNTEGCSKQTGSTCRIVSLSTSDSGVYWCQSESGEKRHPLNITVHNGDVILESSVDPVIEGDTLTLHCLHRSTNPSILRADFYKDGSLVQNQTTGEMSITTVSKSHEGFYYCKTERGESLHSWISVRVSEGQISVSSILSFLLAACPYLLSTVVLLFKCYRARVPSAEDQSQYAVTEETST